MQKRLARYRLSKYRPACLETEAEEEAGGEHNSRTVCASNTWGVESFPMILRSLMATLALAGLVATATFGDATSLCRVACASRTASLGRSELARAHHHHDARELAESATMQRHIHRTANSKSVSLSASKGVVELQLPPCSQYRQFAVLLSGAASAVTKGLSDSGAVVPDVPARLVKATIETPSSLAESPPGSAVPSLSTAAVLRI